MPFLDQLLRRRRLVLAVYLLATAALAPGVLRLASDNSPEVFFVEDAREIEGYRRFQQDFGHDEVVRIVLAGPGVWSQEGLAWLARLEEEAAALPGVEAATGLHRHHRKGFPAWPPPEPGALRRRALADPLDRDLGWVSGDGSVVTLLVVLAPGSPEDRRRLLADLEGLLVDPPPGVAASLAGLPVLNRALDASAREIGQRFFPLLALFALALLALVFRSPRDVVVPLAFVALCQTLLLGTMGYLAVRLNLVLAILAPLVFVVSLATAVHLSVRFRDFRQDGLGAGDAVRATYRDKGWAVLWTGLTTLVGFASLATSPLPPVASLGLWSGLGIGLMTLAAFSLYPVLLAGSAGGAAADPAGSGRRLLEAAAGRRGRRWARWAADRRGWVQAAALAVALAALVGVPRLAVESNALTYLPADHPLRRAAEGLEEKGVGLAAVELVLSRSADEAALDADPLGFQGLAALAKLAELAARLRQEPLVLGAVGGGDLMRDAVSRSLPAGAEVDAAARGMAMASLRADPEGRRLLAAFVTPEGDRARVTLFTRIVGFDRLDPLLARVRSQVVTVFPEAEVGITGQFPLLLAAQHHLLRTLAVSLTVTLLLVAVIFRLLLGSTRLSLLALVPNLWPVAVVLGGMGWLGVPVDSATVMVASVVLGLAVDDTIHTLGHFRELAPRRGRFEAIAGTLERTAPAYLLTGMILAAGFGVCGFSSFVPTARFGALSAVAIALAVVADLFLIPALLGSTPRSVVARMGRDDERG